MTPHRPRNWFLGHTDGQSSNTPSSASSFGFDVAAELSRMNHPTARRDSGDVSSVTHRLPFSDVEGVMPCCGRTPLEVPHFDRISGDPAKVTCNRADLIALPQEQEVGRPADRRRHGDRSRPTAAAVGAASNPHSAGVRRGLIALACCFVAGWLLGHRRT